MWNKTIPDYPRETSKQDCMMTKEVQPKTFMK